MIDTYPIRTVEKPDAPLKCWGVFWEHRGAPTVRVFGPANLYDCIRARDRIVDEILHGRRDA